MFGSASFTLTTMTSPRPAYLRREPPRTLMHCTRRAPELSATSRMVRIWIMTSSSSSLRESSLDRPLDQTRHRPALLARDRLVLADLDEIASLELALFVVRLVLRANANVLAVHGVLHRANDFDHHGLRHLRALH